MVSEMKKRLQRKGARRGFTLVELLIVIIIIGILAGAMMLVAGTSRDAAEASKIISDLRNVKAAALMWLTENPAGWKATDWTKLETDPTPLNKYLDKPLIQDKHRFKFETEDGVVIGTKVTGEGTDAVTENVTATVWFLGYDLNASAGKYEAVRGGVKENLAKQAKSAGLYGTMEIDMTDEEDPGFFKGSAGETVVYIIVQ